MGVRNSTNSSTSKPYNRYEIEIFADDGGAGEFFCQEIQIEPMDLTKTRNLTKMKANLDKGSF